MTTDCDSYPDVWKDESKYPEGPERNRVKDENRAAEKLYRGVVFVLNKNFTLDAKLPPTPEQFVKNEMKDEDRAQFLAIFGILLADNMSDPSFGKTSQGDEDERIFENHRGTAHDVDIIVAKRFIDAVVSAVQEYTRNADLFTKTFKFLKKQSESRQSHGHPKAPPPESRKAAT